MEPTDPAKTQSNPPQSPPVPVTMCAHRFRAGWGENTLVCIDCGILQRDLTACDNITLTTLLVSRCFKAFESIFSSYDNPDLDPGRVLLETLFSGADSSLIDVVEETLMRRARCTTCHSWCSAHKLQGNERTCIMCLDSKREPSGVTSSGFGFDYDYGHSADE